jgi:dihydroneopterin aldolase
MQHCKLTINGFELAVLLGWPDAERQQAQTVRIDLTIQFKSPPPACASDQLQDTFCYDKLLTHLRDKISDREFHLIEHLTAEIHHILKPLLPADAQLSISVLKFPAINGLTGGVTFSIGDK